MGLIGGSLGMAIKTKKMAKWVVGVARKKSTIEKAFKLKALDVATLDLKEGVKGADLVILCAPAREIIRHLQIIAPWVGKNTIVMDVGSSKEEILRAAKKYLKSPFVGCHPMAGSEKCGIDHAAAGLFSGSVCFMTSKNPKVEALWKALGSTPVHLNAKRHDDWVAQVSHLPHVLSFALLQTLNQPIDQKFDLNPSFKDLTRLAKSHPNVWTDILLTNHSAVLSALRHYKKNLDLFDRAIRSSRPTDLSHLISKANSNARKVLPNA